MGVRSAIILGATGLIGQELLAQLLKDEECLKVKILLRRNLPEIHHPKLQQQLVNFQDPLSLKKAIDKADVLFCCIGTTMKNVKGDKSLYRAIDYDIPVRAAEIAHQTGVSKFVLVSSLGANPSARNFYLRLKGEVESAISSIPFESVHIMRPSLLLGKRREARPTETVARFLLKPLSLLFLGSWIKYKSIEASAVAAAMVAVSKQHRPGIHVYEYREMTAIIQDPRLE
jgi:uncharacterized protein YbjT (DUF2867 family)